MIAAVWKYVGTSIVVAGLLLSAVGAYYAAREVWLTPEEAVEIAVTRWVPEAFEQRLELPGVKALLRQSRGAVLGFQLILVGSVLQAVGAALLLVDRRAAKTTE